MITLLKKTCAAVNVTRFDETKQMLEASFAVDIDGFAQLNATRVALQGLNDSISVSFLESKGIT